MENAGEEGEKMITTYKNVYSIGCKWITTLLPICKSRIEIHFPHRCHVLFNFGECKKRWIRNPFAVNARTHLMLDVRRCPPKITQEAELVTEKRCSTKRL